MEDLRIVLGPGAPALERFAAEELQRYLRVLYGPTLPIVTDDAAGNTPAVLIGSPQTNPAVAASDIAQGWPSASDQGIVLRGGAAENTWVVGGGSPVATTWAVYDLVERLGVRYLLSGDVFPDDPGPLALPDLDEYVEPLFTERIWRLMNDEPHGPEMWSLAECRRVIDQIAKMKMNGIYFLTYPSHPFVHYEFRGVAKSTGVLDFGFRYPIDDDTIGRELFGDVAEFTNPEFRHCDGYDDMVEAGQRYARAVFDHARDRGMRIGFGFSLTSTTDEFKERLGEWAPETQDAPADDDGRDYHRLGQLSMGAPPGGRAFQDVDNPALAELAEVIVRAHLETYPEIDFIEIGSSEFRAETVGHDHCWRRLDEKYGIESVAPLEELVEQVRARGYHGEGRAERELKADIEFLYFVDRLFAEGRLLERLGRPDVEVLLSSVTEEMYPILGNVLPPNFGVGALIDYNLSLALPRLDRLSALGDGFGKYVTLSVQDDMNSLLVSSEGARIERFLERMRDAGFKGWKSRYWSIGDLDHSVDYLARASWDADLTVDAAYDDYALSVFGEACLPEMRDALRLLEENGEFQGTTIFAVGFPYPSLMRRHFEMQRNFAGRTEPQAGLLQCRDTYTRLVELLQAALPKCREQARGRLEYMIGRARTCALFLETAHTVERAGFASRAAEQARDDKDPERLGAMLNETARLLAQAVDLSRETIHAHVEIVRDESDLGLLAAMNQYMYKYIKARSYLATLEASSWSL